ncbi:hypothetical protein GGTG_01195 [Gaeumannomyces tritici R3-111a-1]|uniref:Uncharacterized protein n=1 Tax=Gaeumannomyces tritici (strain R3-111a-1) TaxID=644352 RepID=J3NIW1_GAET3|nr:hypothetical protein GGTG_01195 [Gaeumannomyces tritici R3-111a-1]EJT81211.1 hypothetical protein GGTG_01195 [Gaeumannomyces tritici R3-111a-1]
MLSTITAFFASAAATLRGGLESLVSVQQPSTSAETVPVLESLVSPATTGVKWRLQSFTSTASAFVVSTLSILVGICLLPFVAVWLYVKEAVHSFSAQSKSFITARPEVQPRPDACRPLPAPRHGTVISRPVTRSMRLRWGRGNIPPEEMPLFRQWKEELERRMMTAMLAEPSPDPRVRTMPKRVVEIRTKRSQPSTANANGSPSAPVKEQPVKRRSALEATAEDIRQELQNRKRSLPKASGWATHEDIVEANTRAEKSGRAIGRTVRAATYEEVHGKPMPPPKAFRWATRNDIVEAKNRAEKSGREIGRTVAAATYEEVHGKPMPTKQPRTYGWATAKDIVEANTRAEKSGREIGRTIRAATYEEVHGLQPVCSDKTHPGTASPSDSTDSSLKALDNSDCTPWADELQTVYDTTSSSLLSELDDAQDEVDAMLYDIEKRNAEAELPIDRWNAIYWKRKRREERASRNAASRMARNFNLSAASTEPDSSCTVTPERSVFWWHRDL